MRLSLLVICLLFLLEFNVLETAKGSMVTIPASVAFAIITGAVKMKLILVKILFALRTMGLLRFQRMKRSTAGMEQLHANANSQNSQEEAADELLMAWRELESTAERQIMFDFPSCHHGAMTGQTITNYGTTNSPPRPSGHNRIRNRNRPRSQSSRPAVDGYSQFVSSVIGSMTRSPEACHILQESILSHSQRMFGLRR